MADKKKEQAGRRAYLNDFHRGSHPGPIDDGSHFHFAGDGWKQVLLRLWALGIVLVVLVLAGGLLRARPWPTVCSRSCPTSWRWEPWAASSGAPARSDVRRRDDCGRTSTRPPFEAAAGTGRAGDVRRRGRNTGNGAVHDRPRGRRDGLAAGCCWPSAEGGASRPWHGCCGAMRRPCHGRGRQEETADCLMFSVCERRIAISVLFKYI